MEKNSEIKLGIYSRSRTGKGGAFRTRLEDRIPAVVYGSGLLENKAGLPVSLDNRNFVKVYETYGRTNPVPVDALEGASEAADGKVMIKEIQMHPFKRKILHVDLHRLDMTKPLRVTVPLNFEGKAKGVADDGGILSILNRKVEIRCLPNDIPNKIDVDVTELAVGDSIKVSELSEKLSGKYEFIFDSDYAVVGVAKAAEEVTAAPAATEEAAAEGSADSAEAKDAAPADADKK